MKMPKPALLWTALRRLLGLYFIAATIGIIVGFGGDHPPETVAAAGALTDALNNSGFMNPLLIANLLVGGFALFFNRWAPVGILLLAPVVVVIACFHWFLTHSYIWGAIWPIWLGLLAWHYRGVFARLWNRS